jgi:inhibitor of cysteine peptidase
MNRAALRMPKRRVWFVFGLLSLVSCADHASSQYQGSPQSVSVSPDPLRASTTITLDSTHDRGDISVSESDTVRIELDARPSTGYHWQLAETNDQVIRVIGPEQFENNIDVGVPSRQIIYLAAIDQGVASLKFLYRRPWEEPTAPTRVFQLTIRTRGTFTGLNKQRAEASWVKPEPAAAWPSQTLGRLHDGIAWSWWDTPDGYPSSFNWCANGGCSPVRNQGDCGSCWAFATVAVLESLIMVHDWAAKDLSEQYLVSCNSDGWSCDGGREAHDYHQSKYANGELAAGAVYEADFPYSASNQACNAPHSHHERIQSWGSIDPWDLKQRILGYGPVTTGVCAGSAFQHYAGGVFKTDESSECDFLGLFQWSNHLVTIVGWDDLQGVWIVKNSWGSRWGESWRGDRNGELGYMRLYYGMSNSGRRNSYVNYPGTPENRAPIILIASGLIQ